MDKQINYSALTMDEIVFLGRNKDYGAFDLRRSYPRHVKHSLLGIFFITLSAISLQMLYTHLHPTVIEQLKEISVQLTHVETSAVKPPPPIPPGKSQQAARGSENAAANALLDKRPVVDHQQKEDSAILIADAVIAETSKEGDAGELPGRPTGEAIAVSQAPEKAEDNTVHSFVEEMPVFPGGEPALLEFLKEHVSYPDYENQMGISGKAVVGFVVDENGKVSNVHVLKHVSAGIDREAERVVKLLPNFKPGRQAGRNVKVSYVVPISFSSL